MNRMMVMALLPLMLGGCEMTVDVSGMLGVDEPLVGSMTHYDDGGTIELSGGRNTHCIGSFSQGRGNDRFIGRGTMVCDDRRAGPFRFKLEGRRHGQGSGTLNGIPYSFTF